MEESKLKLESVDIAEEKRAELLRLFPEAATEGGKIDFDQLNRALGEMVDVGRERYGMSWPGKADCFRVIQSPSTATLLPAREKSIRFDDTENLIIEGDNLEVLKLLQKGYQGKVKMIYIDPPYNTGNDFIYPDDYADSLKNYLQYTGQVDAEGKRFSDNLDTDGRFHSKWLNMMYPRLYLAKNLLRDDGVIFISISDTEMANLREVCDTIFGGGNFIACVIWEKSRKNDAKLFSVGHEYILAYARSLQTLKDNKTIWREEKPGAREIWLEYLRLRSIYKAEDRDIERDLQRWYSDLPKGHPAKKWSRYKRVDSNGPWRDRDISWPGGDGPDYDVLHPVTKMPCKVPDSGWRYSTSEEMQRQIKIGLVEFREDHTEPPFRKAHIKPIIEELDSNEDLGDADDGEADVDMATQVRGSYIYKQSQVAVKYLQKLMGAKVFDNPKDHEELKRLQRYVIGEEKDALFLDFFAGSGVLGEATIELNEENDTAHRFILVQLPVPVNAKERSGKAALKLGLRTVVEITQERVRRAIRQREADRQRKSEDLKNQPTFAFAPSQLSRNEGFRVFKLAPSNFKVWDAHTDGGVEALEQQLELAVHNVRQDRTPEDLLYEILLKSEFPLTAPVTRFDAAGTEAFSVQTDAMIVCVAHTLTEAAITAIAARKPLQVVFLDEGFSGNDQLKKNARLNFEAAGVTRFQTI